VTEVAAVLAAGSSSRLGVPKQLLRLPSGACLVRHSTEQALAVCPSACAVVAGKNAKAVEPSLQGLPVTLLPSEDPDEGIAASIRAAAAWADAQHASALLLCVCDQPLLSAQHLTALLETWRKRARPAASLYGGQRAVPAVFPSEYFPSLLALRGDRGAAALLRAAPSVALVPWPEGELDVDTPEDWAKVAGYTGPR
jgi:CTP:molybdopterin cytidylyltransferase MocA